MLWSTLLSTGLRAGISVYSNRHTIQKWWTKLLAAMDAGESDVVILGRQNVGKSLLCSTLHGEASQLSFKIPSTSVKVEPKAIQIGEWTKLFRVIPGQGGKEREQGLQDAFDESSSLKGVIYVVDWGYTDERDPLVKNKLITERNLGDIEKIRKYNLEEELRDFDLVLNRIKNRVATGGSPKWLIIAVNKIDLFFQKIDEAQNYYHPQSISEFTKLLNEFLMQVGTNNFKCACLPIMSWDSDFSWNNIKVPSSKISKEMEHAIALHFISEMAKLGKHGN